MKELEKLFQRIVQRTGIKLRNFEFEAAPLASGLIPLNQLTRFYALCGVSPDHLPNMEFARSSLGGSYFLGKCKIIDSILYKSDIRGDELKKKDDVLRHKDMDLVVARDEGITIEDSLLIKTLVHNFSHDPGELENFFIRDTISAHYANIHGSPSAGCFLGPFATIDLTTARDCAIGAYTYVQAGDINRQNIGPGTVWVQSPGHFNFLYRYPSDRLDRYIRFQAGLPPQGLLLEIMEDCKAAFERLFEVVHVDRSVHVPASASLDRYAVIDHQTTIKDNVLIAQRAFLKNAWLGKGANAQENCCIINSHLEGNNVTAHGATIIDARLGKNVFVGFNSLVRGHANAPLRVGEDSIIMPHTIIDAERQQIIIPDGYVAWGLITNQKEAEINSCPQKAFSKFDGERVQGDLAFEGDGATFINAFRDRIQHILEANGAFYNGASGRGHAQRNQSISFNILQPYPGGTRKGLHPAIVIKT
ncbi:MAG: transferase [Desulfosarcinaceae bacterium]